MSKENIITVDAVTVETTPEEIEALIPETQGETTKGPVVQTTTQAPVPPETPKAQTTLADLLKKVDNDLAKEEGTPTEEDEKESKSFLEKFKMFISGQEFENTCENMAEQHGVPKKQIATSFLTKALGTISDILHIAIGAIESLATSLVKLVANVLLSGASIICNVARSLARLITFNQTAKA